MYCGYSSKPFGEALLVGRGQVAHDAGHQTGHRLDHDSGRRLAAGQHKIANRQLPVDEVLGDPLVDAFVTPAQQRETRAGSELAGHRLVEAPTSGAEQVERPHGLRRLHRGEQRLGRQDHAGSPAERAVVDAAARVVGAGAQVMDHDVDRPAPPGLPDQARPCPGRHELGEDRENLGPASVLISAS